MPSKRLTRCPFHPMKALRSCPCRHLKCEKHPSVLKIACACPKHLKVDQSRFTKPRHIARMTTNVQTEATITYSLGVLVICGACGEVAVDYSDKIPKEHTVRLVTFIRTDECKHCGGYVGSYEACPKSPTKDHERKWLVRAKKVAACVQCSLQEQIQVEPEVFDTSPQLYVNAYKAILKQGGLL